MSIAKLSLGVPALLVLSGAFLFAQHGGSGSGGHGGGMHAASGGHGGGMHAASGGLTGLHPSAITPNPQGITGFPASAYSIGVPASAYSLGLPPSASRGGGLGYPAYNGRAYSGRRGRNAYPYGYGYPYFPYYPLWDGSSDYDSSGAGPYAAGYQDAAPPSPDDSAVGQQLAQLSAQVNDLQYQLSQGPQQSPYFPQSNAPKDPAPPSPPLTVVLTNGQTLHVQNYAVMGNMFWDFSSQPVRKIPVSTIDVPASTKATEATGAEFPPLSDLAKTTSE